MEKYLLFKNYQADNCGLSNRIISLELAIGIAYLTNRTLILDNDKTISYGSLKSDLKINEVFDIPVPYISIEDFRKLDTTNMTRKVFNKTPFYDSVCLIKNEYINFRTDDDFKQFANGRRNEIFIEDFECDILEVLDEKTLCNYSYFFYIRDIEKKKKLFEVISKFKLNFHHSNYVSKLVESFKNSVKIFNSIHIRRTDFEILFGKIDCSKIYENIKDILPKDEHLVILTDNFLDKEFFKPITSNYNSVTFIDESLSEVFKDEILMSLISREFAVYSKIFIGSLKSTFTSLIQRNRLRIGLKEEFLFHSTNEPDFYLKNCEMEYDFQGRYSWNGLKLPESLKNILFWIRDFEECTVKEEKVLVIDNFISEDDSNYLKGLFLLEDSNKEFYKNENRDRIILDINNDDVCNNICRKISEELNISNFELQAQLFETFKNSEVRIHVDSLAENEFGKRTRTILIYLNDDYEGGDLFFPKLAKVIKPKKNSLVTYESYRNNSILEDLEHGAFKILKGKKYLLILTVRERNSGFKVLKSKKIVIFIKRDGCGGCEGMEEYYNNFKNQNSDIETHLVNISHFDKIDEDLKTLILNNKKEINFTPSVVLFNHNKFLYITKFFKKLDIIKQKINELF